MGTFASRGAWVYVAAAAAVLLLVRRSPAVYAGVVALSALAGHVVAQAERAENAPLVALAEDVPSCSLVAIVAEHAGGLGTLLRVERLVCGTAIFAAGELIAQDIEHDPGSEIVADGWVVPLTDDVFDRARSRAGAAAAFHARDLAVVRRPTGLLALAASFRDALGRSTEHLEPRSAALLRGLTIGDTSGIDEESERQFRRTGLAHLVAVSGSNVAIVVAGATVLVRRTRPVLRVAFCGTTLCLYVLVVGPDPSVLRAAAMGGIALAGILYGRRAEPIQALGVALIVLLCFRPALVSSVGLHLSAAATLGIVLWARSLAERLSGILPGVVAYVLGTTLAAQIAVAPIIVIVFGEVSLVAPLANLLAAAAVAPATVLGLAGGLVGLVSPRVASWFAGAAEPFARWIVEVAERLARPSWAAAECPAWIGWAVAVPVVIAAAHSLAGLRADPDRLRRHDRAPAAGAND